MFKILTILALALAAAHFYGAFVALVFVFGLVCALVVK